MRSGYRGPTDPRTDRIVGRNAAVKEARGLGMDVPGLARLRRDFRRLKPEVDKALRTDLRDAAKPVRARGRELAPSRSGALKRSLRISVQSRGVAITSRLPYANVIHWGGSVGEGHKPNVPWSGAIMVDESLFLSQALEEQETEVFDAMGSAVERAAVRSGWR